MTTQTVSGNIIVNIRTSGGVPTLPGLAGGVPPPTPPPSPAVAKAPPPPIPPPSPAVAKAPPPSKPSAPTAAQIMALLPPGFQPLTAQQKDQLVLFKKANEMQKEIKDYQKFQAQMNKGAFAESAAAMKHLVSKAGPLLAILGTVGVIATQSKIISTTISSWLQLVGAFMDTILAPLVPYIARALTTLASVVAWVGRFMQDPGAALKEAWNNLVNWIKENWLDMLGWEDMIKPIVNWKEWFGLDVPPAWEKWLGGKEIVAAVKGLFIDIVNGIIGLLNKIPGVNIAKVGQPSPPPPEARELAYKAPKWQKLVPISWAELTGMQGMAATTPAMLIPPEWLAPEVNVSNQFSVTIRTYDPILEVEQTRVETRATSRKNMQLLENP